MASRGGYISEETILVAGVFKWAILATAIGIIVGFSTGIFLKALEWSTGLGAANPTYFLLLPVALAVNVFIIKYIYPESNVHTTDKMIEYVHKLKRIPIMSIPKAFLMPIITLASGGSAGKEAPAANIGAGLGSLFSEIINLTNEDRRKLVICGISAGFASVFGAPIAGAVFGVEVLFMGSILYEILLPAFIAGIISYQISAAMGITYFYQPISVAPVFSNSFFMALIGSGLFFGICSAFMIETFKYGRKLSDRIRLWAPFKAFVAGFVLVILTLAFSTQYLGLGLETIQSSLEGQPVEPYSFVMKTIFTSVTLNFGGAGGVITPTLFVGATSGTLFGQMFNEDLATFAAIGLVALLAGVTSTPIASSILALELFGPTIAPYATIACIISFIVSGNRTIFPSQVSTVKKTYVPIDIDEEVGRVRPHLEKGYKALKKAPSVIAESMSGPPEKFEKYSFRKPKSKFSFEGLEDSFRDNLEKLRKLRKKKKED